MPPIFLHMAVARDVSRDLPSDQFAGESGTYLLGATSPDIRVLTRWARERTHFFDLARQDHQDSVATFFAVHPELADAGTLGAATVAFVSGYISHLALDETWIEGVYRRYFGQLSALGGDLAANTMDRVLQFELDRQRREDPEASEEIRCELAQSSLSVDVGFLDSETLHRWLEIAMEQAAHPADWERFRFQASRHLRQQSIETDADWQQFRDRIPYLLQQTIDHVSTAQIDGFLEQGTENARKAVRMYLGLAA
jgi:hypothetical protein